MISRVARLTGRPRGSASTRSAFLIASGSSHNRAPSEVKWKQGVVLSLDSGGNFHGYIGDLALSRHLLSNGLHSRELGAPK